MKLQRLEREHLKLTVRALNAFGIARFSSLGRTGNNHVRVNFYLPNGQPAYVLVSNSNDVHARRNIYMNVKKAVTGQGARQKFQYRG